MHLTDLLSPEVIKVPLAGKEKYEIIEELIGLLDKAGRLENRDLALNAVVERERQMSTGMGDGIAIPHAKTDAVKELSIAFGITRHDVDFQAIDGKPVRLFFLLVGPTDQTALHLKMLSRISRLMHKKEFRDQLRTCMDAEEVLQVIGAEERKYFPI
ncbi:MAG: PTS sugar transporter subunit IIA [candidate division KSB1 bacterium]|nr:PTS sugar transporter subunit IIA [candidate division KSB1 bacterium]MDZ7371914.1 PTS sugar transporter subunit IIA [candidate division KSB1 bacterium]